MFEENLMRDHGSITGNNIKGNRRLVTGSVAGKRWQGCRTGLAHTCSSKWVSAASPRRRKVGGPAQGRRGSLGELPKSSTVGPAAHAGSHLARFILTFFELLCNR